MFSHKPAAAAEPLPHREWRVEPRSSAASVSPSGSVSPGQHAAPAGCTPSGRRTHPKEAILRLDKPGADSLSTSRILRIGNLGPFPCRKGPNPCRSADQPTAPVTARVGIAVRDPMHA